MGFFGFAGLVAGRSWLLGGNGLGVLGSWSLYQGILLATCHLPLTMQEMIRRAPSSTGTGGTSL